MKLLALTVATLMVAGASFAQAEMLTFKADLTAASEVPPAAKGTISVIDLEG